MIKIPSVNPVWGGDGEAQLAEYLASEMLGIGMKVTRQGIPGVNRFNIIGEFESGEGPTAMLCSHMDTVTTQDMDNPFNGKTDGHTLYGRGACDAKASLAGMLEAVRVAVQQGGTNIHGKLVYAGICDEEYQSVGAVKLAESLNCDYVVNGEPTQLLPAVGHRGFVWLKIQIQGQRAHGSVPEKGVDAISNLVQLLSELLKTGPGDAHDALLGGASMHMGTIGGGLEPSVVPSHAEAVIEYRTVPPQTGQILKQRVQNVIDELKKSNEKLRGDVKVLLERPPFKSDHLFIHNVEESVSNLLGRKVRSIALPYWTDMAILGSRGQTKGFILGPGDSNYAHSSIEQVSLSEVASSARVYLGLITRFLAS
jgi:acetylornithine deacetylase/succinyl-diaminopimelate desuccinylase-like protein